MNTDRTGCDEAREKLPLYIGGDLDAGVLESVGAHLDACPSCAALAEEATRARRELVHALRARAAGSGGGASLWAEIRENLQAEGLIHAPRPISAPEPVPVRPLRRWARTLVPLAAAAALIAVVQLGGFLTGAPGESTQNSGGVAHVQRRTLPSETLKVVAQPAETLGAGNFGALQRVAPSGEPVFLPEPYRVRTQRALGRPTVDEGIRAAGFRPRGMK